MYPETKAFFIVPADRQRRSARCYDHSEASDGKCPDHGYHNATAAVDEVALIRADNGYIESGKPDLPNDAPWPTHCSCGYVFKETDRQTFTEAIYRRADTGEEMTLRDAPPGAMWDATWMSDWTKGSDGRCLVAKCPNGREWMIDGRASNCTMPQDNEHKCWVRHGEPPNITVDKNGRTCAAGAGSILSGDYHGFLRNGIFTAG